MSSALYNMVCSCSKVQVNAIRMEVQGAKLSNIPDYQTVPVRTFLTGNILFLPLYVGCTTYQSNIPFAYLLYLLIQGHQGYLLCFVESS